MFPMRHLEVIGSNAVLCGESVDKIYYADRDMFRVYINQCPECLKIHKEMEQKAGKRVIPRIDDF